MIRTLVYSVTGTYIGAVFGFLLAIFSNMALLGSLIVGACIGCGGGFALASRFDRGGILKRPFLAKADTDLLVYLVHYRLDGLLPARLIDKIVSRLRAFLERRV